MGTFVTIGYIEYRIKRDAHEIITSVLIEERELIIKELGKAMEEEINNIIESKKEKFSREIQNNIEKILVDKREELGKEMERAIDQYIKDKIRSIF